MISIKKAADELDRAEELLHSMRESYGQAIRSTAQYAVEMDPAETVDFRAHLNALQERIETARSPQDWQALQTGFRGELREYHDKTSGQLARLRQDIASASEAVKLFAQNVSAIDSGHEVQIKEALEQLEAIAHSVDPSELQAGIRRAAKTIAESVEVMQQGHQAANAQLRDEIRLLHKQIDVERNVQFLDRATGVWNREKLDSHVGAMLERDRPFCILLVCVRNLPRLDLRYSRAVIDGALKALLRRLESMLEKGAVIGRWDEQNFAAILEMEPSAAMHAARAVTKNLAGDYSVQDNAGTQCVALQAVASVIDHSAGSDENSYQQKLLRMSQALAEF